MRLQGAAEFALKGRMLSLTLLWLFSFEMINLN